MNRVPLARRTQIINCLVEGNSIRSTERMTGMRVPVDRDHGFRWKMITQSGGT